ncbi:hydroxyethylthiazole kinase [Bifidobacterium callitrichos]|nr:hydroxyethylthiazole kinase [Bifidobacterium callitrichos]
MSDDSPSIRNERGIDSTYDGHGDADGDLNDLRDRIRTAVEQVRATRPLAQSFTNFVTINLVANAQLAAGGAAAMSFLPDDVIDTAPISGADYINVGTLLPFYKEALPKIARAFHKTGHKWVLDPVAAGIGQTRTEILRAFRATPPTIVRGNASEIIALADMWGLSDDAEPGNQPATRPAGVEAVDEVDTAVEPAKRLARFLTRSSTAVGAPDGRAAVAVSGEVDLVTDGETVYRLPGGSAMMTKVTGAGCSLGGVTATYLAVIDPLTAALTASALYDRAGEIAEAQSNGPGSFQVAFLDALWNVTADQVAGSEIHMF